MSALQTYNNQMFQGSPISVTPSIVKPHMAVPIPRDGGGERGGGRGGGGVYTVEIVGWCVAILSS